MKKMKTALTAAVLVMALSMGAVPAFAADGSQNLTGTGEKEVDVNAVYDDQVAVPIVHSVDLSWGSMNFTYTASGTKTWNAATLQYDVDTTGAWTAAGNTITVKNLSNIGINAGFEFASLTAYNTITGSFDKTAIVLPTAEGKTVNDTALSDTTTLTLAGTLSDSVKASTRIGTVTITIADAE